MSYDPYMHTFRASSYCSSSMACIIAEVITYWTKKTRLPTSKSPESTGAASQKLLEGCDNISQAFIGTFIYSTRCRWEESIYFRGNVLSVQTDIYVSQCLFSFCQWLHLYFLILFVLFIKVNCDIYYIVLIFHHKYKKYWQSNLCTIVFQIIYRILVQSLRK